MINWTKININELVNKDGTRIGANNVQIGQNNSKSASNSTSDPMYDPEDGDQLKNAVSQQRQNGYRGWKATMLLPMQAISYMSDEDEKTGKSLTKEKIKKSSKKKMTKMVEDIVNKKFSKEVLDKVKINGDINKNGVPDIEIISDENPLLVRKVKNLIDIISKNQATGEQKGVILNYLINNIGSTDIPMEYKSEMLKKLR